MNDLRIRDELNSDLNDKYKALINVLIRAAVCGTGLSRYEIVRNMRTREKLETTTISEIEGWLDDLKDKALIQEIRPDYFRAR